MIVPYEFVHVHVSTMLFCVDVLITQYFLKQSAYINRGLFLGRYCDVSSYRNIYIVVGSVICLSIGQYKLDYVISHKPSKPLTYCFKHVICMFKIYMSIQASIK